MGMWVASIMGDRLQALWVYGFKHNGFKHNGLMGCKHYGYMGCKHYGLMGFYYSVYPASTWNTDSCWSHDKL